MAYSGIETGFYSTLTGDADVAALVGTAVYAVRIPENATYPAVHFLRTGSDRGVTVTGNDGFVKATITITCLAQTYIVVKELANEVRKALIGFDGSQGDHTVAGCYLTDENDEYYSDIQYHGKQGLYGVVMTYTVHYYE